MILELLLVMLELGGEVDLLFFLILIMDILLCCRRLGLRLDFGVDDYICVLKRCKLEFMNIFISYVSVFNKFNVSNNNVNVVFMVRIMLFQELVFRMNKFWIVFVLDCCLFVFYNIVYIQGVVNVNCLDRFNR